MLAARTCSFGLLMSFLEGAGEAIELWTDKQRRVRVLSFEPFEGIDLLVHNFAELEERAFENVVRDQRMVLLQGRDVLQKLQLEDEGVHGQFDVEDASAEAVDLVVGEEDVTFF